MLCEVNLKATTPNTLRPTLQVTANLEAPSTSRSADDGRISSLLPQLMWDLALQRRAIVAKFPDLASTPIVVIRKRSIRCPRSAAASSISGVVKCTIGRGHAARLLNSSYSSLCAVGIARRRLNAGAATCIYMRAMECGDKRGSDSRPSRRSTAASTARGTPDVRVRVTAGSLLNLIRFILTPCARYGSQHGAELLRTARTAQFELHHAEADGVGHTPCARTRLPGCAAT